MNKIYKLIWSKTKNCWVVASELAKGHGKNKSRVKNSLLAAFVMSALLAGGVADVQALTQQEKDEIKNEVALDLLDKIAHGGEIPGAKAEYGPTNFPDAIATRILHYDDVSSKIGEKLKNDGLTLRYFGVRPEYHEPSRNYLERYANKDWTNVDNDGAFGAHSMALGYRAFSEAKHGVAIGRSALAGGSLWKGDYGGDGGVAIGNHAWALGDKSVSVGNDARAVHKGIAIGIQAEAGLDEDDNTTDWSTTPDFTPKPGKSIQYDPKTKLPYVTSDLTERFGAIAIGTDAKAHGRHSTAIGTGSKAKGHYAWSLGFGSEASAMESIAFGNNAAAKGLGAIAIGSDHESPTGGAQAYSANTIAIGRGAKAGNENDTATEYNSIAIGPDAQAYSGSSEKVQNSTALGAGAYASKSGVTAVGASAVSVSTNSTVVGYKAVAASDNSVVLGANTRSDIDGGVALGSDSNVGSYASPSYGKAGKVGYDPLGTDANGTSTWKSTKAAVSVGNQQKDITRQIINVAAGSDDTDAVNVAQLKSLGRKAWKDLAEAKDQLGARIATNTTSITALSGKVRTNTQDIGRLKTDVQTNDTRIRYLYDNMPFMHYVSVKSEGMAPNEGNYKNDGAKKRGAIAIGAHTTSDGDNAVALGAHSFVRGQGSVIVGESSDNYTGGLAAKEGQFDQSIILGSNNTIFAQSAKNGGREDKIIGNMNRVEESHGTFVRGTGNMVYDAYNDEALTDEDKQKEQDFLDPIDGGDPTGLFQKGRSHVTVEGDGNLVGGALYTQVSGVGNEVSNSQPDENSPSTPRVTYNIVTGNRNTVVDSSHNLILGDNHELENVNGNIIIGSQTQKTATKASNATILGNDANVSVEGGVALGTGSVASTAAEVAGYDPLTGEASAKTTATWKSGNGAVSVGTAEKTRQITNLAAGLADTDAVNVAQLKSSKTAVEAGDYVTVTKKTEDGKGTTYTVKGPKLTSEDTNLKVTDEVDAGKKVGYKLQLSKTLTGLTSVTSDAFKVGDKTYINSKGINANNNKITNVAAGAADGDAVNFKQLSDVKTKVEANEGNITTNKNTLAALTPKVDANETNITKLQAGFTVKAGTGKADVTLGGDTKQEVTFKAKTDKTSNATESLTSTVDANRNVTYSLNINQLKKDLGITAGSGGVMSSWKLKAAGETTSQEIKDGNEVTFDVKDATQGLTVKRENSTIKYGIDKAKLAEHITGDVVTNINNGTAAVTNISAKFSVTDGTNTKAVNLGKGKNNNVKFLGTAGETTVTVGGNDDAPTVTVGLAKALKDKIDKSNAVHYFSVKSGEPANPAGTNWDNKGATGQDAIAIGSGAKSDANGAVSLGHNAKASVEGGVALGAGSIADTAAGALGYISLNPEKGKTIEDGYKAMGAGDAYEYHTAELPGRVKTYERSVQKYEEAVKKYEQETDADEKDQLRRLAHRAKTRMESALRAKQESEEIVSLEAAWKSTQGAVSVGGYRVDSDGIRRLETRQITGVAAGTKDSDAVNVAQLKASTTRYFSVNEVTPQKTDKSRFPYTRLDEWGYSIQGNQINDGAKSEGAVAVGENAEALQKYGAAFGYGAKAKQEQSLALGLRAEAEGSGSVAMGGFSIVEQTGKNSLALGRHSRVTAANSVALGAESFVGTLDGIKTDAYLTGDKDKFTADNGVVSVGRTGYKKWTKTRVYDTDAKGYKELLKEEQVPDSYRRIINVAGGAEDTDAVNVAQLKAARTTIEAGDYVTVTSEKKAGVDGTVYTVKGPTLTAENDNLIVSDDEQAGKKVGYKVKLNKTLTGLESVSSKVFKAGNNVTINNNGLTITGGPSVTTTGINAGSKKITNVAAGTADGDAVNVKQLNDVDDKVTTNTNDITTLKKGWTLEDGNATKGTKTVKAADTVKVKGDDYITATVNDAGLKLGMNETKLNSQINNQINTNPTVTGKMNSWVLKAATTDKDPTATGQTIDNTNNVATFDVEDDAQGLTVKRTGATIQYGIDKVKLASHITGNVITNINNGDTAITNIAAKFSVTDGTNTKAVNLGKGKNNNVKFLGADGETTVTVGGNDDAPTVTVGLAQAFKDKVTKNATDITNLTGRVNANADNIAMNKTAIAENKTAIGENKTAIGENKTAIGENKTAIGENKTAIGKNTTAIGENKTAIGENKTAIGENKTAIGENKTAIGENKTAIGENKTAIAENKTAIGENKTAIGENKTAIGENKTAIGENKTAIGENKTAIGENKTAIAENKTNITNLTTRVDANADNIATNKTAIAENKTAIGENKTAIAENKTAIGENKTAIAENKTAIGENKTAIAENKTAIGENKTAIVENKTAIGENKTAIAENKTAIGENKTAIAENKTAIGENKTAIVENKTAIGENKTAIAENKTAINENKTAINENKTAINENKTAINENKTAINENKTAINENKTAINENKTAINENKTAIEQHTKDIAKNAGDIQGLTGRVDANADNINANTEKIGKNTNAIETNTEKIGKNTNAIEKNTKAIASKMTSWKLKAQGVAGEEEIKDGNEVTFDVAEKDKGLTVTREGSTIKYGIDGKQIDISENKTVNELKDEIEKSKTTVKAGDDNISVKKADDKNEYTLTLAKDLKDLNSVSAKTVNADTVSAKKVNADTVSAKTVNADTVSAKTVKVGDNVTLNDKGLTIKDGPSVTKDGINAGNKLITGVADGKKETDAVNVRQLTGVEKKVDINSQNISILGGKVVEVNNRVNRVGASAASLAALHPLDFDPDDKWDFAAGYGNYKGANAVAIGAYYRPNEDTMFSVGGSFGGGENMVNAGVSVKLGQGNHVTTSRVAMAKEIKDLRAEVEVLRQAVTGIGQGQTPDPVKMKLFPDIAKNHWAYEAVEELTKQGLLEGYPDGTFGGDRMMTRYEFAEIVYRAMQKGLNVNEKLIQEFEPELERFRIDVISKDKNGNPVIERVRVNEKKKAK